jgi:hypothetical protein
VYLLSAALHLCLLASIRKDWIVLLVMWRGSGCSGQAKFAASWRLNTLKRVTNAHPHLCRSGRAAPQLVRPFGGQGYHINSQFDCVSEYRFNSSR